MPFVRVKGFQIFNDRHGKPRCYHRKTKEPIDLSKYELGSAGFFSECARITALTDKGAVTKAGTLGALIDKYRSHPAFCNLSPKTQVYYQDRFDYLIPIQDTLLTRFTTPLVVNIRDKAAEKKGSYFGNTIKVVLSIVFSWGVERGYIEKNYAKDIKNLKKPKDAPEANRPWEDHERHAVLDSLPLHMLPAFSLMMYCGIDLQDVLSLPRSALKDGKIDTTRGKTGEPVWMPLPQPVVDAIRAAPPHDGTTVCANSFGLPWTPDGFRASWRTIKTRLELEGKIGKGLTSKGLRHTVATILAELGFDNRSIADMLAQKTELMAAHYARRANRSKKNEATMLKLTDEMDRRRTASVKPPLEPVKPTGRPERSIRKK